MAAPDETMKTATDTSGAGHLPEHFDGAAGTTTKNGKHPRREYAKVASEAPERSQASAGPAMGEDGHGATTHSAGQTQEEGGDETPRGSSAAQNETDNGETEERAPPERLPAPNASGC